MGDRLQADKKVAMALANRIREFRFRYGEMTQKELADLVGVSRQTMNAIENGKHAPTIDVAIRIADVFRECVDCLFSHEYEGKPEFIIVCLGIAGDRDGIGADLNG